MNKKQSPRQNEQSLAKQSPIDRLGAKLRRDWPAIRQAGNFSARTKERLAGLLADHNQSDTSIVVFGSLARNEFTSWSDLDWTLLVDGQADAEHLTLAHKIRRTLEQHRYGEPGPTGVFGNIAFSHPIVHEIGGEDDTNKNTTRRVLLLLESCPIGKTDAYNRVLEAILERYIDDDSGLGHKHRGGYRVPRFLLNDIVRYWRTITVDFVHKQKERDKGWALRNAKLRMSRKLLFAAGILVCFGVNECEPAIRDCMGGKQPNHSPMLKYLKSKFALTPLEILAQAILDKSIDRKVSLGIFERYELFLSLLGNRDVRDRLKQLSPQKAENDRTFGQFRKLGQTFHENVVRLLYHQDEGLRNLTESYGVF